VIRMGCWLFGTVLSSIMSGVDNVIVILLHVAEPEFLKSCFICFFFVKWQVLCTVNVTIRLSTERSIQIDFVVLCFLGLRILTINFAISC